MPSPPLHEPMSLFQAREFWSAATGTEEEFGGGCLAIANLDNDPGGQLKIATGSFSGMRRSMVKVPALAVPQLGSCTSPGRQSHWAPSYCLGCSSEPPPKLLISPPLTV